MKILFYCCKAKPYIMKYKDGKYKEIASFYNKQDLATCDLLNGKIVAECDFEVEEIEKVVDDTLCAYWYETKKLTEIEVLKKSCLMDYELDDYLGGKNGYAIHIKNLHIFDEPRELSEYMAYDKSYDNMFGWAFEEKEKYKPITKAPQNMMYAYDNELNKYILISIQPQWLCKILNGEKTIEIRKKVLKEML